MVARTTIKDELLKILTHMILNDLLKEIFVPTIISHKHCRRLLITRSLTKNINKLMAHNIINDVLLGMVLETNIFRKFDVYKLNNDELLKIIANEITNTVWQ